MELKWLSMRFSTRFIMVEPNVHAYSGSKNALNATTNDHVASMLQLLQKSTKVENFCAETF